MNLELMTKLLCEQVPVLEFVRWCIIALELGSAETLLPLNPPSTNQRFTHQAALFLLTADYTGGLALSSLIHGWPVVGVHPETSSRAISLWLTKAELKYFRPSVADLTAQAAIPTKIHSRIQKRSVEGRPVVKSVDVEFFNDPSKAAEATMIYYSGNPPSCGSNQPVPAR